MGFHHTFLDHLRRQLPVHEPLHPLPPRRPRRRRHRCCHHWHRPHAAPGNRTAAALCPTARGQAVHNRLPSSPLLGHAENQGAPQPPASDPCMYAHLGYAWRPRPKSKHSSIHICQVMHTHEYITFFAVGGLAGAAVSSALLMVAVVTWTVCRRKRALHPAPPSPTPTTVELEHLALSYSSRIQSMTPIPPSGSERTTLAAG